MFLSREGRTKPDQPWWIPHQAAGCTLLDGQAETSGGPIQVRSLTQSLYLIPGVGDDQSQSKLR